MMPKEPAGKRAKAAKRLSGGAERDQKRPEESQARIEWRAWICTPPPHTELRNAGRERMVSPARRSSFAAARERRAQDAF